MRDKVNVLGFKPFCRSKCVFDVRGSASSDFAEWNGLVRSLAVSESPVEFPYMSLRLQKGRNGKTDSAIKGDQISK